MRSAFVTFAALTVIAAPGQVLAESSSQSTFQVQPAPAKLDPQALQLAREFVTLTSPADVVEKQYVDHLKAMTLIMPGQEVTPGSEAERELDQTLSAARPAVRRHLPAIAEAVAQAYARTYSAEELRQIIAFAGSPVGERLFLSETEIALDPAVIAAGKTLMEEAAAAMTDAVRVAACQQATRKRIAAGDTNAKCPLA